MVTPRSYDLSHPLESGISIPLVCTIQGLLGKQVQNTTFLVCEFSVDFAQLLMSRFLQIRVSELSDRVGYHLPTGTLGHYKQHLEVNSQRRRLNGMSPWMAPISSGFMHAQHSSHLIVILMNSLNLPAQNHRCTPSAGGIWSNPGVDIGTSPIFWIPTFHPAK
jgi:hypothetical protein